MKKYRLIKEYPGSVPIGSIISPDKYSNSFFEVYKEFYEEVYEFEKGDWIKILNSGFMVPNPQYEPKPKILKIETFGFVKSTMDKNRWEVTFTNGSLGYGYDGMDTGDKKCPPERYFRLATDEEIKDYLISVAKEKGYDKSKVSGLGAISEGTIDFNINTFPFEKIIYKKENDTLYIGTVESNGGQRIEIYKNGKWAEIISNKIPDKLGIFHISLNKPDKSVSIGCYKVSKEELETFLGMTYLLENICTLNNTYKTDRKHITFGSKGFTIGNNELTIIYDDLKNILKEIS